MKTNILLSVFTILSFACSAQNKDWLYQTKSLTGENVQQVEAKTTGGNISMMGSSTDNRIEIYVQASNSRDRDLSKSDLQKRLNEDYTLTVSVSNHKLTAIAEPKSSFHFWNKGLSISFKIWVSRSASSDLETSGGNISMRDLSGDEHFRTSGGNLDVENLSGKTKGRTSGGNIYLKNSSSVIDLTTSGGNIDAENSNGALTLSTSGGDVVMNRLNGNIKATTSGGNIKGSDIQGVMNTGTSGGNVRLLNMACTLEAGTSGGNIFVSMNKMGSYLKLHNSGGHIEMEVPGNIGMDLSLHAEKVRVNSMSNFKGSSDEHHIEGTLSGGGIPVTASGGDHITLTVR